MFDKIISLSEFTRNVLTVLTGTALAQAVPILISPILTRLFSTQDFGVFFLFTSVLAIMSVISTGKYELTIILPEKDEDAMNIVVLVCSLSFGVSSMLLGIVLFFKESIQTALGDTSSGQWLYLLPLSLLLSGVYQACNYWSNRKKKFKELSIGKIGQSGVTGGSNWTIGEISPSGLGLVWSTIAGQVVNISILLRSIFREDRTIIACVSTKEISVQAKRYRAFPKQMVLANIFNISAMHLPNILLSSMFGPMFLGVYALSQRVVKLPLTILSNAFGEVFKQEAAEKYGKGENIKPLFWKSLFSLALISLPLFVVFYLFAPDIFSFVFGEKWLTAGEYARILTPYFYLAFIAAPLTHLFYITGRTGIYLAIQGLLLSSILGGLYYGSLHEFDPETMVTTLSVTYGLIYIIMIAILVVSPGKK